MLNKLTPLETACRMTVMELIWLQKSEIDKLDDQMAQLTQKIMLDHTEIQQIVQLNKQKQQALVNLIYLQKKLDVSNSIKLIKENKKPSKLSKRHLSLIA